MPQTEIEKNEDFEPNIYNTLYNLSIDVMDKIDVNSAIDKEWIENQFLFLSQYESDILENRILDFKKKISNWEKSLNVELIVCTPYQLNSSQIESIIPNAIVIFIENKYKGDEKDLSKMKNKNIFYYGSNPDRFIRYFGKLGLAIKL